VLKFQTAVRGVVVEESVVDYLLDLVEATRKCDELSVGVSTRGALSLYRASQASAALDGRSFVTPDDIKQLAVPALSHRVIARGYASGQQRAALETLIRRLVSTVRVPI
jgi:MoxR-like ATPase